MDKEPKKARGGKTCSAFNCKNRSRLNKNVSYFSFPRDKLRSKQWAIALRREDLISKNYELLHKNFTVCSNHFEDCMFANAWKNRLYPHALPTLSDVPNPPPQVSVKRRLICRHVIRRKVEKKVKISPEDVRHEHSYSKNTVTNKFKENLHNKENIINDNQEVISNNVGKTITTKDIGTQTKQDLFTNSPREKRLMAKILKLRQRLRLQKKKTKNLASFLKSGTRSCKRINGRKYS